MSMEWKKVDREPGDIKAQPWDGQPVLVAVMPEGALGEAYFDHERDEWHWANTHWTDATSGAIRYPTHWMPLPAPPSN